MAGLLDFLTRLFPGSTTHSAPSEPAWTQSGKNPLAGRFEEEADKRGQKIKEEVKLLNDADRFIEEGNWMPAPTASGNTVRAKYNKADGTLSVQYRTGQPWNYRPITPGEARAFFLTGHKQSLIWQIIRVKGKGNFHKHQVSAWPGF